MPSRAKRERRPGVVRHHLAGMEEGHRITEMRQLRKQRADLFFGAKQQETQVRVPLQRNLGTPYNHARRVIAAHRVKGDRDAFAHLARPLEAALPLRPSPIPPSLLRARHSNRRTGRDGEVA